MGNFPVVIFSSERYFIILLFFLFIINIIIIIFFGLRSCDKEKVKTWHHVFVTSDHRIIVLTVNLNACGSLHYSTGNEIV